MNAQPQVDFYVLRHAGHSPDRLACRLAGKGFEQGMRIFIRAADPDQARALDDLLWTFDQLSFLPHALAEEAGPEAPIQIGTQVTGPVALLINLAESAPEPIDGYARIAEIVGPDTAAKNAGRRRYKHYQGLGVTPATHKLDQV